MTFLDVVFRLAQGVAHKFQRGRFVEVLDGEYRLEHLLEAEILALRWLNIPLQEKIVGVFLDFNQVGKIDNLSDSPETATKS